MISTRMHVAFAKGISSGPSTKLVVQSHLQFQSKGIDDTGFCGHYTYTHNQKILIKIIQVVVTHTFNPNAWKEEASGSL